jgi:hypothetical protein
VHPRSREAARPADGLTGTKSKVGYSQSSDGCQSKQAPKALFSACVISRHLVIVASYKSSLIIRPGRAAVNILLERSRADIFDKARMDTFGKSGIAANLTCNA